MDKKYNRLAIFLMDATGAIVYKTNQLETNHRILGEMKQTTREIAAVSFLDVNHDNLKDIILITRCDNGSGKLKGESYKVGDVLFQEDGSFYRDYRISEKINRFSMNKSARCIISFVRDGKSAEFLYTATTSQELLDNNFNIIEEQCYPRTFEKLGRLQVVPGTFSMGDYDVFMIYLVNDQGNIVWSFQPMEDYDNLYSLRGISCKDLDGDGMKDLVVLARYSYENPAGELVVESDCAIYYQRTGGFDEDFEFAKEFQCTDTHKMEDVVREIRKYWGWNLEETTILTETGQKIK
ncbi:MAG: VCBS repeat-containing protein [Lachnospiraceae bacterium]|nr:VCBS repeat-containing protein [Lachnospiraceae bacterium]